MPAEVTDEKKTVDENVDSSADAKGEGDTEPDDDANADGDTGSEDESGGPSEEDRQWAELKKYEISPQEMVALAAVGWEQTHKTSKAKADEPAKPQEKDKSAPNRSTAEFISKDELSQRLTAADKTSQLRMAQALNDIKVDAKLDAWSETRDDAESREQVKMRVWKSMAGGMDLDRAFKAAKKEHGAFMARINKRFIQAKAQDEQVKGEPGTGESATNELPTYDHKSDDFHSGRATEQAMDFLSKRFGPPVPR